ncbi:MAG: 30S ribosome-binding factor RbfA [Acidobacteriales bacterium]|nr:30S ribosome-binding factor RbfA [Terriglobales bacterium]
MPEQRSRTHSLERRADALRDEIGAMLEGELADPRIGLATVSEVVVNPGGKSARVYVTVSGDEKDAQRTIEALNAAKAYIRSRLQESMGTRHTPDLTFVLDLSTAHTGRIEQLLGRVEERRKKKEGH